jgi:transcriptional regulator with XRE-family HTH domain
MHMTYELGKRVRAARTRRGIHHAAAADLAGLPARYWAELEAGLRERWASLALVQVWRLCEAVGLHPSTLFLGL